MSGTCCAANEWKDHLGRVDARLRAREGRWKARGVHEAILRSRRVLALRRVLCKKMIKKKEGKGTHLFWWSCVTVVFVVFVFVVVVAIVVAVAVAVLLLLCCCCCFCCGVVGGVDVS